MHTLLRFTQIKKIKQVFSIYTNYTTQIKNHCKIFSFFINTICIQILNILNSYCYVSATGLFLRIIFPFSKNANTMYVHICYISTGILIQIGLLRDYYLIQSNEEVIKNSPMFKLFVHKKISFQFLKLFCFESRKRRGFSFG